MKALRMPISIAARKGLSAVVAEAAEQRIVLTRAGHAVAVVDSAEGLDETARVVRSAAREVLDSYANLAVTECGAVSLADLCARLGLDEAVIRDRAVQLRARARS